MALDRSTANDQTDQLFEAALECEDYDQVVAILNSQYAHVIGEDYAVTLKSIVARLPEEIVARDLWASVCGVVACEMQRDYEGQKAFISLALERACHIGDLVRSGMENAQDAELLLCTVSMLNEYHRGNFERVVEIGRAKAEMLAIDDYRGRIAILCVAGMALWSLGRVSEAREYWRSCASCALFANWEFALCLNRFGTALASYAENRASDAMDICLGIFAISDQGEEPIMASTYAHLLMGRIYYDKNELEAAEREIDLAAQIAEAFGEMTVFVDVEIARAHISAARSDKQEAMEHLNRCAAQCARSLCRDGLEDANAAAASVWLHLGKPRMAVDCLEAYWNFSPSATKPEDSEKGLCGENLFGGDFRNVWRTTALLDKLRALIQLGETEGVMSWLDAMQAQATKCGHGRMVFEILIEKSLCAFREGNISMALGHLSKSFVFAETEGYVRPYVDRGEIMRSLLQVARRKRLSTRFLERVLSVARNRSDAADGSTNAYGERFTKREIDVMRKIVVGATNDEIASELFLGLSTVKNHIHSIYRKLGVRNRAEAIVSIQELKIID